MLTIKVYTVDRRTLERSPAREVNPAGGGVFTLLHRWPPCQCPMTETEPGHAERVASVEHRLAR